MQLSHVKELEQKYILGTYARFDVLLERGSGCYLVDSGNKRYLDLLSGIGVNALGYNHPRVKQILRKQIKRPIHLSNYFYNEYQGRLAEKLCRLSGLDRAFFTNSGAESIEACLKFARAYAGRAHTNGGGRKYRVLAMDNAFHGRTFGALSATATKKYREPFEPLVPGFDFIEANNVDDLERKLTNDVCALLIEMVQGEGGVRPISEAFYRTARRLTAERGALLVADEIQCGLGRTGKWFAFQEFLDPADSASLPDMIACAKPLGLGIPMGAVILRENIANAIKPGEHGTTFGGGPLACRASLEYFKIIEEEKLLSHIRETGAHFKQRLDELKDLPVVKEVRGMGLMLAVELHIPGKDIVKQLLDQGFIINCTHDTVLRFLPPFVITTRQVDKFVKALRSVLEAQRLPA
jgi:acetylornithine aminotransferase/acetylornithine/N-succinyldiaminopimelate aminotransferase